MKKRERKRERERETGEYPIGVWEGGMRILRKGVGIPSKSLTP